MIGHFASFNNTPLPHLVTVYWLLMLAMSAVSLLMYQVSSAAGLDTGSRQSAVTWSPSEYLELTP